jgi:hypothetical protein
MWRYVFEFVTPHPFPKMSEHSKSAVHNCFFNRRSSVSGGCLLRPKSGPAFIDSTLTKYLVKESQISKPRYPSPRHDQKLLPSTSNPHDLSRSIVIPRSITFRFLFFLGLDISVLTNCRLETIIVLDHTAWHTTLVTTPLDEGSAGSRDYLETRNTHKVQTSTSSAGFELAVPGSEWPKTYALDRPAMGPPVLYSNWLPFKRFSYPFLVCPIRASAISASSLF